MWFLQSFPLSASHTHTHTRVHIFILITDGPQPLAAVRWSLSLQRLWQFQLMLMCCVCSRCTRHVCCNSPALWSLTSLWRSNSCLNPVQGRQESSKKAARLPTPSMFESDTQSSQWRHSCRGLFIGRQPTKAAATSETSENYHQGGLIVLKVHDVYNQHNRSVEFLIWLICFVLSTGCAPTKEQNPYIVWT